MKLKNLITIFIYCFSAATSIAETRYPFDSAFEHAHKTGNCFERVNGNYAGVPHEAFAEFIVPAGQFGLTALEVIGGADWMFASVAVECGSAGVLGLPAAAVGALGLAAFIDGLSRAVMNITYTNENRGKWSNFRCFTGGFAVDDALQVLLDPGTFPNEKIELLSSLRSEMDSSDFSEKKFINKIQKIASESPRTLVASLRDAADSYLNSQDLSPEMRAAIEGFSKGLGEIELRLVEQGYAI